MSVRAGTGLLLLLLTPARMSPQVQPPASIRIEVVEGEGAINSIAERRAKDPVVKILDDDLRPIAGATVTFVTPELGASAVFTGGHVNMVTTDANGMATGFGLKPNNVAGEFQIRVTASFRGQTATATIGQTNAAPVAVKKGNNKTLGILIAIVAGGGAAGAALALGKKSSTTASTPTTPAPTTPAAATTISPGGGTFGPP